MAGLKDYNKPIKLARFRNVILLETSKRLQQARILAVFSTGRDSIMHVESIWKPRMVVACVGPVALRKARWTLNISLSLKRRFGCRRFTYVQACCLTSRNQQSILISICNTFWLMCTGLYRVYSAGKMFNRLENPLKGIILRRFGGDPS